MELLWFRWPNAPKDLKIIDIDIDPSQMPRIKPTLPIVADSRAATRGLIAAVMNRRRDPRIAAR